MEVCFQLRHVSVAEARGRALVRRTGGGGKWRVFVRLHCACRKLTPELARELSHQYKNRSAEDDEILAELGGVATVLARARRKGLYQPANR